VDDFLDFVRRSGVTDIPKLAEQVSRYATDNETAETPAAAAELLIRDGLLTHFQAEQILQGRFRRFFIGKYKVLERLGSGGMGQVFLCEHKLMRRRVAIKVLPASQAKNPASLERFYREARAVAAVDHPNIVRAYDIDQDADLHFLVMEHVDGVNFQDLVRKSGPLDIHRACHYVYATCVGLQHSLEMGLVHRDIKPGNVLVDRTGTVKILDMGLAKFFEDEADSLTQKYDENVLGTADYLAPEQAIDSHGVDIRADIYALGGTFYYLLTGSAPFPTGSIAQKLLWHQQREPAPLTSLRADVPAELVAVVTKMMAKDPAARYQRPDEVMEALTPWVQSAIATPSAEELPNLSRAAKGTGGPITSRIVARVQAMGLEGLSAKLSPSGSSFAPVTPSPLAPSGPATPTPAASSEAETASAWETFTSSEAIEFRPPPPRIAAPPKSLGTAPPSEGGPVRRRKRLRVFGAAVTLVAASVAVGLLYAALAPGKPDGATTGHGRTWYVKKSGPGPDADRTLTTLAGAIDRAGRDDTVAILDAEIDDPPVRLSDAGKGAKRGLKLQPGPGVGHVRWTPRYAGKANGPALDLSYCEGFTVRDLVIDLRGVGEVGVAVSFQSPGLTVENVTVLSPRVAGFRLQQLNADAARPAVVRGCRVATNGRYESAVVLNSGANFTQIAGNRFEGPAAAGVAIEGQAVEVEVRNNRVWNCDVSVSLTGKLAADRPYDLRITQNTFFTAATAGVLCELPLTGPKHELKLERNYFGATKVVLAGLTARPAGLRTSGNTRDAASPEGPVSTDASVLGPDTIRPPDPKDDATFLRSPALTTHGAQKE